MFSRDRYESFSGATIALHWLLANAIIFMIPFGISLDGQPESTAKTARVSLHISVGLLVLLVGVLRLGWRMSNGLPQPARDHPLWQRRAARIVHILLLIAPIYTPVGGIMFALGKGYEIGLFGVKLVDASSTPPAGLEPVAHVMHGLGGFILALIIVLHVAGALKHQFIDHDGTMRRIFGRSIAGSNASATKTSAGN
jgi:cytochrome b561